MINENMDGILIEKTINLVESLDKYFDGLVNQSASTVEWSTLILAFIAALTSIISIYMNYKSVKKNRESNEKIAKEMQIEENKRTEATIDANLTASARIEWIQNVRKATAELITACYKYIRSETNSGKKEEEKEKKELQEKLDVVQEKINLLILYFGHDDDNFSEETIMADDLFNKKTNKGKNNKLVSYINKLHSGMSKYHANHSYIKIRSEDLNKCYSCSTYNSENSNITKEYNCTKDIEGTPFNEEDCKKHRYIIKEDIKRYKEIEDNILKLLQDLSEIMRVYLKIEWSRSKEGK